ncbi:MAG: asparagine synthase (glutamine-hydrolyzing) [Microscillaceae bacterium]|jgi:asparagine synthase (glutamine-hydrolysing)|nr:asparagine synthase (glutamine-hydrolyzing) [Microscillaceae bacterium]
MCGITGIYAFNEVGRFNSIKLSQAVQTLTKRGPDANNMSLHHFVNLGHTRLAIIDLSTDANQPMKDESGRYTIIFNGEIYSYREMREKLIAEGVSFRTSSDTEVLLKGYIHWGAEVLQYCNGFFAFAIFDEETQELFIARDRLGIKPLLIYQDEDKIIFGSEMKALIAFGITKEIDYTSLWQYLHLNYIPAPYTIFKNVRKLLPGHYLKIKKREVEEKAFYEIPNPSLPLAPSEGGATNSLPFGEGRGGALTYEAQQKKLIELLDKSIQRRLIADVPLGAFLSGGIDSSIITALASRHTDKLNTFSIGYRDEPFFDETKYANLVAKKFNTNHTVFKLSNDDLYAELFDILDYIDEPFADSSAIAVYILSKHTRKKATVALSGDGADELFSGYNKHWAEFRLRKGGMMANWVTSLLPLWQKLPKSRNGWFSNKIRQFQRFAEGMKLPEKDRYWQWAGFAGDDNAFKLFSETTQNEANRQEYAARKAEILKAIKNQSADIEDFNQVLYTDMHLVLANDMLTKVDLMSMANALEVRVPFLDHEVVNFVAQLPVSSKINGKMRKRILQDAFRDVLPAELYNRPKHGFEVPMLKWLRGDLRSMLENDLLADKFIEEQGIFSVQEIQQLKQKLFSNNPEDSHARVWALLVFQYWWKKYMK